MPISILPLGTFRDEAVLVSFVRELRPARELFQRMSQITGLWSAGR